MTEHLEGHVGLKELAAYANLSIPHFTFRFKEATGYSPSITICGSKSSGPASIWT